MQRLTEIDSLRGLAALSVVAFHYTTKYDELYAWSSPLPAYAPSGWLGVYLFFVISGFVIFMTLERTRVPMDFVVSRASRLYPAYWTAVALTFWLTHLLGLPGKEVGWKVALLNVPMFQQLFRVPLVDGVYWTLVIELLFYAWAFALYLSGRLHRVLPALAALLALRFVYWGFAHFAGIDLPWRIRELLILDAIPFFALGIVAYRLSREAARVTLRDASIAALAILALATDSLELTVVGTLSFAAVWLAATGRLPILRLPVLVWLGTISYPLYLLHENIGWAALRQLQLAGWSPLAALAVTVPAVLALSAAVSFGVERPAMAWIRERYRRRTRAVPIVGVSRTGEL